MIGEPAGDPSSSRSSVNEEDCLHGPVPLIRNVGRPPSDYNCFIVSSRALRTPMRDLPNRMTEMKMKKCVTSSPMPSINDISVRRIV